MQPLAFQADSITLDDLARIADTDRSHRYELSAEGVFTVMPPPDVEHATIITRLIVWFAAHGYPPERVLSAAGVKVGKGSGGRQPDVVICARTVHDVLYLDPGDVALTVEVESRGSRDNDRITKPREYAEAGIPNYWRVTRRDGSTMVSIHVLAGAEGYECRQVVTLNELLQGDPATILTGSP